eukprot:749748-Alexandrium_andersonii.AAC.1
MRRLRKRAARHHLEPGEAGAVNGFGALHQPLFLVRVLAPEAGKDGRCGRKGLFGLHGSDQ